MLKKQEFSEENTSASRQIYTDTFEDKVISCCPDSPTHKNYGLHQELRIKLNLQLSRKLREVAAQRDVNAYYVPVQLILPPDDCTRHNYRNPDACSFFLECFWC